MVPAVVLNNKGGPRKTPPFPSPRGGSLFLLQDISVQMEHTMEHVIKRQVISVHPDGHCLFRALGKNHSIHPGEVTKYIKKNKCRQMVQTNSKMKQENNEIWYTKWANKTKEWADIKSNVSSHCNQLQWGGVNEVQIWVMIIKQTVIILDSKLDTATIFHPRGDTLPETVNLEKLNKIHNTETRQNKKPQYILYNGRGHYNSISAEDTIGNTKTKTENNIHRHMHSKSKLRRKIEQTRNKRIKNSKLNKEEHMKRRKRQDRCVVETDPTTKATGHRARFACSISNTCTETYQATEPDNK